MKRGQYVAIVSLAMVASTATAQPLASHWDVGALRQEIMEDRLSFEVAENWVTRYLANGGDIKAITGLERPANWLQNARFVVTNEEEARIPREFDWRRLVPGGLQSIRNQGGCGSCWAFAVTAVLESIHIIKNGHSSIDLAEQTLVSSCERGGSCSGGYFDAFDYVQTSGLPPEGQDPYRAANSSCKSNLTDQTKIVRWSYVGASNREPTTDELKAAILKYGPIAVEVNASFGAYSSGVFDRCVSGGSNHMVTLEGWNDDDQAWIMRNSWGTGWGENGYMKIKYVDSRGRKCNNIGKVAAFAEL